MDLLYPIYNNLPHKFEWTVSLASKLQKDLSIDNNRFKDSEGSLDRMHIYFKSQILGSESVEFDPNKTPKITPSSPNLYEKRNSSRAFI